MSDELKVELKHLRQLGYCRKGARKVCAEIAVDWNQLRTTGIPLTQLESVNDVAVQKLIALVKEQADGK